MDPARGGPCQGIRNSIPACEALGVETEVVCLDAENAAFLGSDGFRIHALGAAKGPWSYSPRLLPWLVAHLRCFDAVIVHGLWLYHGHAVRRAMAQLGHSGSAVPAWFVMPHGMLDPYFQRDPSRRLKALRNVLYWKLIEAKVVNQSDGVLFTCEEELRLAREPFRPYQPKLEINVGYGVAEPPAFSPAMREAFQENCPELGDRPYLLFLSRIHPKKGVDLLIQAYAQLAKEQLASPSSTASARATFPDLVIAGPLDSAYAAEMQQLAAQLLPSSSQPASLNPPPSPRIHFPGMLRGDAKWGAFYGCEAFVLPSHQENFGIAVVEALACGKPVLISNKVNIWREIEVASAGLVCADTLESCKSILRDYACGENNLCGARDCYTTHYSVHQFANRLVSALSRK